MQPTDLVLVQNPVTKTNYENIAPFLNAIADCVDLETSAMAVLETLIEDILQIIATSDHDLCYLSEDERRLVCVYLFRLQAGIRKCSVLTS
ncbi:MAG: hypothetical protein ACOVOV_02465 [Dolichospermum sp.]